MFRALFVITITFAYVLFVGTPFLLLALITRQTGLLYEVGRLGARLALWLGGVRLDVHGREKIPAGRAVVFMPNHQSNAEPPALFTLLPPILALGKEEFFRVPIIGQAMRLRGFIPVDRKNREKAIHALEAATKSLKAGNSFLVFPEGTRSPDGRLQPFKKGVFIMAIQSGAPIVPISVSGSNKIMPKGKLEIVPGVIRITIHDPVATAGLTLDDRERLSEAVRKAIVEGLAPEERPSESEPSEEKIPRLAATN